MSPLKERTLIFNLPSPKVQCKHIGVSTDPQGEVLDGICGQQRHIGIGVCYTLYLYVSIERLKH